MLETFLLDMCIVDHVRLSQTKIYEAEAVHIRVLEIESIFSNIFAHTNVVWFYVVMDDPTFMKLLEQCRDFDTDLPHGFLRKPYSISFINYLLETHSQSVGREAVSFSTKSFIYENWEAIFSFLLRFKFFNHFNLFAGHVVIFTCLTYKMFFGRLIEAGIDISTRSSIDLREATYKIILKTIHFARWDVVMILSIL